MLGSSFQIAKVWGIPIKVHITLVLLLPFLASRFGFLFGMLLETGLFASITLHELGHSLVAIKKGCKVREILLMPIGGAAQMEEIPTRPMDEFLMAIAGPAVSLGLGIGGLYLGRWLLLLGFRFWGDLVLYLGFINCFLVGFNLLPSFPMDGGRVLRAVLTPKLGRLRATFIAARLGRVMAVLFGLYGLLASPIRWSWIAIAFFIFIAAGNEYRYVQMQESRKRRPDGWPPFGFGPPPPPHTGSWAETEDDQVVISPPPYEKGPEQRIDVQVDSKGNPLGRFFRR